MPAHHGVSWTALDDRAQNDAPDPSRVLPLDLGLLFRHTEDGARAASE